MSSYTSDFKNVIYCIDCSGSTFYNRYAKTVENFLAENHCEETNFIIWGKEAKIVPSSNWHQNLGGTFPQTFLKTLQNIGVIVPSDEAPTSPKIPLELIVITDGEILECDVKCCEEMLVGNSFQIENSSIYYFGSEENFNLGLFMILKSAGLNVKAYLNDSGLFLDNSFDPNTISIALDQLYNLESLDINTLKSFLIKIEGENNDECDLLTAFMACVNQICLNRNSDGLKKLKGKIFSVILKHTSLDFSGLDDYDRLYEYVNLNYDNEVKKWFQKNMVGVIDSSLTKMQDPSFNPYGNFAHLVFRTNIQEDATAIAQDTENLELNVGPVCDDDDMAECGIMMTSCEGLFWAVCVNVGEPLALNFPQESLNQVLKNPFLLLSPEHQPLAKALVERFEYQVYDSKNLLNYSVTLDPKDLEVVSPYTKNPCRPFLICNPKTDDDIIRNEASHINKIIDKVNALTLTHLLCGQGYYFEDSVMVYGIILILIKRFGIPQQFSYIDQEAYSNIFKHAKLLFAKCNVPIVFRTYNEPSILAPVPVVMMFCFNAFVKKHFNMHQVLPKLGVGVIEFAEEFFKDVLPVSAESLKIQFSLKNIFNIIGTIGYIHFSQLMNRLMSLVTSHCKILSEDGSHVYPSLLLDPDEESTSITIPAEQNYVKSAIPKEVNALFDQICDIINARFIDEPTKLTIIELIYLHMTLLKSDNKLNYLTESGFSRREVDIPSNNDVTKLFVNYYPINKEPKKIIKKMIQDDVPIDTLNKYLCHSTNRLVTVDYHKGKYWMDLCQSQYRRKHNSLFIIYVKATILFQRYPSIDDVLFYLATNWPLVVYPTHTAQDIKELVEFYVKNVVDRGVKVEEFTVTRSRVEKANLEMACSCPNHHRDSKVVLADLLKSGVLTQT